MREQDISPPEVRLARQQRLQPAGCLGQAGHGDLGQTEAVAGDVQVATLQVSRLLRSESESGQRTLTLTPVKTIFCT